MLQAFCSTRVYCGRHLSAKFGRNSWQSVFLWSSALGMARGEVLMANLRVLFYCRVVSFMVREVQVRCLCRLVKSFRVEHGGFKLG